MPNSILTPDIVAKEALHQLDNELVMAQLVSRDYAEEFVKVGDTVRVRKPFKYTVRDGATASLQDSVEGNTSVTIDKFKGVDFSFSSTELTLRVNEFSDRHIKPAMRALANQIDLDLHGLHTSVHNYVGSPGTAIADFDDIARAAQRLKEQAVPGQLVGTLSPNDEFSLLATLRAAYIQDTAKAALTNAKLPRIAGVDLYSTQNVPAFTTGARGSACTVNGASQVSTYESVKSTNTQNLVCAVTGSQAGYAVAGDVFTIAGVFAVNPVTGAALDYLQQFVVNTTANSSAGALTLNISPAIITTGAYKTVSAAPANGAAVTFLGAVSTAYRQNMVFAKDAFTLAMRPLEIPAGVTGATRQTFKNISVRIIPYYTGSTDVAAWRLDVLYGVKAVRPEFACRVAG